MTQISMEALTTVAGGMTRNDQLHMILNAWDRYATAMKFTTEAGLAKANAIQLPR